MAPASPVCADNPTDIPTRPSPCPRPSSAETYLVSSPPPREALLARCAYTRTPHPASSRTPSIPTPKAVSCPSPQLGELRRALATTAGGSPGSMAAAAAHGRYQHLMPVPSSPRGTAAAQSSREQHEGSRTRCPGRVRTRLTALDAWTPLQVSVSPPAGSSVCEPPHSQQQSAGYLPVSSEERGPCTHTRAGTHTLQSPWGLPGPRDSCLPRTALPCRPRDAGHPGGCTLGAPATRHTQRQ